MKYSVVQQLLDNWQQEGKRTTLFLLRALIITSRFDALKQPRLASNFFTQLLLLVPTDSSSQQITNGGSTRGLKPASKHMIRHLLHHYHRLLQFISFHLLYLFWEWHLFFGFLGEVSLLFHRSSAIPLFTMFYSHESKSRKALIQVLQSTAY